MQKDLGAERRKRAQERARIAQMISGAAPVVGSVAGAGIGAGIGAAAGGPAGAMTGLGIGGAVGGGLGQLAGIGASYYGDAQTQPYEEEELKRSHKLAAIDRYLSPYTRG